MFLYNSSDNQHNLLIQQLWLHLEETGDLKKMFYEREQTSSFEFMTLLAAPRWSFFDVDDKGIWMLVWFSEFLNSIWMGLWCREDMRHKPAFSKNLFKLMSEAFSIKPLIIGVTKQPDLLAIHKKLGYNVGVAIPELYGGDLPGWIVYLHKDNFKHLKEPENG